MTLQRAVRELQCLVHPDRWTGASAVLNAEAFKMLGGTVSEIARQCDAGEDVQFARGRLLLSMQLAGRPMRVTLPTDGRTAHSDGISMLSVRSSRIELLSRAGVYGGNANEGASKSGDTERPDWRSVGQTLDSCGVRIWRGLSQIDCRTALHSVYAARYVLASTRDRPAIVVGGPPRDNAIVLPASFTPADVLRACDSNDCVA